MDAAYAAYSLDSSRKWPKSDFLSRNACHSRTPHVSATHTRSKELAVWGLQSLIVSLPWTPPLAWLELTKVCSKMRKSAHRCHSSESLEANTPATAFIGTPCWSVNYRLCIHATMVEQLHSVRELQPGQAGRAPIGTSRQRRVNAATRGTA